MEENKTECLVVSAMQDLGRVEFDTILVVILPEYTAFLPNVSIFVSVR